MSVSHTTNFDQSKAGLEVLFPKVLEARESRVNELATRIFEDEDLCGVICSQIEIRQTVKSLKNGSSCYVLIGLDQLPSVNKVFSRIVQKRYQEEVKLTLAFAQGGNKSVSKEEYICYLSNFYAVLVRKWVRSGNLFFPDTTYTLNEIREKVEKRGFYYLYDWICQDLGLQRVAQGEISEKSHFDRNPNAFGDWVSANREQLEQVEKLDLNFCSAWRLPSEIAVFKNLKKLSLLFNNELKSLPEEILTLNQLTSINVAGVSFSDTFKASEVFKRLMFEKQIFVHEMP